MSQLSKSDPALADRLPDHRRLIAFRNVLIHGYADIDDALVWGLIHTSLGELLATVRALSDVF